MRWDDWSRADRLGLVRYVTPEAEKWLALGESAFDAANRPEGRRELIRVIYETLAAGGISYDVERFHPSASVQPIRSPAEILKAPRKGTCLDLAVLFCGICLANRLLPILIVIEHHALAAVSLKHGLEEWNAHRWELGRLTDASLTDVDSLLELVSGDHPAYLTVECTGFAKTESLPADVPEAKGRRSGLLPFPRAVKAGREQLTVSTRPFQFALDIAFAQNGLRIDPFHVAEFEEGDYLYRVNLILRDRKDARAALSRLRRLGERRYTGPPRRRFDPMVLVNRKDELDAIANFFDSDAVILYVHGTAGVGKSTVVRGALELQTMHVPAVWIPCDGVHADDLLSVMNGALDLGVDAVLRDSKRPIQQRIDAVLGAITEPSILILDGFERLLDENGRIQSEGVAALMQSLTEAEHRAKLLVSTRTLPEGVGEGSAGVAIERLRGLNEDMAKMLFQVRAGLSPEEVEARLSGDAFDRLEGNPKLIELLASATSELLVENVSAEVLEASDVTEYITRQVIEQLNPDELTTLEAAAVFRDVFPAEALFATCSALRREWSKATILKAIRSLVRRSILDIASGPSRAYYVHPILREASALAPEREALAHAAASKWFGQVEVDAAIATTWHDTLYHLRRAAELDSSESYYRPYFDFVFNHFSLSDAGWGRRVCDELNYLAELAQTWEDAFASQFALAVQLRGLDEDGQALAILRDLDGFLDYLSKEHPEMREALAGAVLTVKTKLGLLAAGMKDIDEARTMAAAAAPLVSEAVDVLQRFRYAELRFAIARAESQPEQMLEWANQCYELAKTLTSSGAPADGAGPLNTMTDTDPPLVEAHFNLAMSYMHLGDPENMMTHLAENIRLGLAGGAISRLPHTLFNYALLVHVSKTDPVAAGAIACTSRQIELEIGMAVDEWREAMLREIIEVFLSVPDSRDLGRNVIANISMTLVPYYDRALQHSKADGSSTGS